MGLSERGINIVALESIEVPLAGKIIEVNINVGGAINEGDIICILESMKMENPILSPVSGTIKEINVTAGESVKAGGIIAIIEY